MHGTNVVRQIIYDADEYAALSADPPTTAKELLYVSLAV